MNQKYPEQKEIGPIVGVIIIVGVLLLGGFHFWYQEFAFENQNTNQGNNGVQATTTQQQSS